MHERLEVCIEGFQMKRSRLFSALLCRVGNNIKCRTMIVKCVRLKGLINWFKSCQPSKRSNIPVIFLDDRKFPGLIKINMRCYLYSIDILVDRNFFLTYEYRSKTSYSRCNALVRQTTTVLNYEPRDMLGAEQLP